MAKECQEPTANKAEKLRRINAASLALNKRFGEGTVVLASSLPKERPRVKVKNIQIVRLLGGGPPKGGTTHVYGPQSGGKTTLTFDWIADAQEAGEVCAFVDQERAFDPAYAESRGVNLDELVLIQPKYAEEGFEAMLELAKRKACDMVVFDSFVAQSPKFEQERDLTQDSMALIPRLGSQFFRMFVAACAEAQMACIILNQLREAIGSYGNPEKAPGGRALSHYALCVMGVSRTGRKEWPEGGYKVRVKLDKTKVSGTMSEGSEVTFDHMFGAMVDPRTTTIQLAKDLGIIRPLKKASPKWVFDNDPEEVPFAHKKDEVVETLLNNEELFKRLEADVYAAIDSGKKANPYIETEDDGDTEPVEQPAEGSGEDD